MRERVGMFMEFDQRDKNGLDDIDKKEDSGGV